MNRSRGDSGGSGEVDGVTDMSNISNTVAAGT